MKDVISIKSNPAGFNLWWKDELMASFTRGPAQRVMALRNASFMATFGIEDVEFDLELTREDVKGFTKACGLFERDDTISLILSELNRIQDQIDAADAAAG